MAASRKSAKAAPARAERIAASASVSAMAQGPVPGPAPGSPGRSVHDLDRQLPYLIARAGNRIGQAFSRELRPYELSLTEWRVCVALHQTAHQRLADLALVTSTEQSTLSRAIDGLLKRGILLRDRSEHDARALKLSLTPDGRDLVDRIIPLAQLYERVAMSGLTPAQGEELRRMLRIVYANIDALDGGTGV